MTHLYYLGGKKLHQEQGQGARVLLGNHKLRAKNKKRDIQVLLLFFLTIHKALSANCNMPVFLKQ